MNKLNLRIFGSLTALLCMLCGCASQEKADHQQEDCSEEQEADSCEDESDDEDVCKRQEIEFHDKSAPAALQEAPLAPPASSERAAEDAVQREEIAEPVSRASTSDSSAVHVEKQEIVHELIKKGEAQSELLQALMAESSEESLELEETEE